MESNRKSQKYNRRKFIKAIGFGAVAAGVSPGCTSPKKAIKLLLDPGPEPLPPTRVYPAMPRALVSISGVGDSLEKTLREAVLAAGGLAEIEKGQRVMIKPNVTGPSLNPTQRITTNPEVIRA